MVTRSASWVDNMRRRRRRTLEECVRLGRRRIAICKRGRNDHFEVIKNAQFYWLGQDYEEPKSGTLPKRYSCLSVSLYCI